jgi:hypothetical protein
VKPPASPSGSGRPFCSTFPKSRKIDLNPSHPYLYKHEQEMECVIEEEKTQEIQEFSIQELNQMREAIETMSKFNQIEVLRILNDNKDATLNENKYGVHVNLTDLKPSILFLLKKYIQYVNTQEMNLNEVEKQKEEFKNSFFTGTGGK